MVANLTLTEALSALVPLLGATGVGGILIAYFAYRGEVAKGRRGEPQPAALQGISALLADSESITRLSISIAQVALAADKLALLASENRPEFREAIARGFKLANDLLDELRELRRAIEDKD